MIFFLTHRCPLEIPQIGLNDGHFLQQHLTTPLFLCQPRNAFRRMAKVSRNSLNLSTATQCKGWYSVVLTLLDRSIPTQIYDIFASIQSRYQPIPFKMTWHFNIRKANNFTCKALKTVVVVPPCDLLGSKVIAHGLTKKTVTSHESRVTKHRGGWTDWTPSHKAIWKRKKTSSSRCFLCHFLVQVYFFGGKYKTTHWKLRPSSYI